MNIHGYRLQSLSLKKDNTILENNHSNIIIINCFPELCYFSCTSIIFKFL